MRGTVARRLRSEAWEIVAGRSFSMREWRRIYRRLKRAHRRGGQ